MNKTAAEQLGYGYLFHFNEYLGLWECAHRDNAGHLFGDGINERNKFVASGKSMDEAASNYTKKFKLKS